MIRKQAKERKASNTPGIMSLKQAARAAGFSLVFAASASFAAIPVEDSLLRAAAELDTRTYSEAEEADLWASAGQGSGSVSAQASDAPLLYQVQVLQQQLRELSGLVEEQAYIIKKLQRDQREQYVDLDRRIQALSPNRPSPGPTAVPDDGPAMSDPSGASAAESSVPAVTLPQQSQVTETKPSNEREAYGQAIQWMRDKRFEDSTRALQDLIVDYPNGQFTPNAFYWLGELQLATGERETARQNFVQVVRLYPDHQKVPDALYKLGVIYYQLGDDQEARRYLEQVQKEHPQSSAGTLAGRYLAEME
jgi:tol-pal system protein YbgF